MAKKRVPQTEEHKRKMVETRRKNGSYVAWNKGKHVRLNPKGEFKKGSATCNNN